MNERLLIVGIPLSFHMGGFLLSAGRTLGMETELVDIRSAFGNRLIQGLSWRLRDRRPAWMGAFEKQVVQRCTQFRPRWLLATGLAPLSRSTLNIIGGLGVQRLNYLTDDPWNPAQRSNWFLDALPGYDFVFSPRKSNLSDLISAGCGQVQFLPFAYDPQHHHSEPSPDPARAKELACDILFVGGADADRVPIMTPLIQAGFNVALHGGYWDRFQQTKGAWRGHADPALLRQMAGIAKVTLILVRRGNRDGHVMRSFESAACRSCLLVEDTPEHRAFFGAEGECCLYFDTVDRMIQQARKLLSDEELRQRLADAAYQRIVIDGRHTYTERLRVMLATAGS